MPTTKRTDNAHLILKTVNEAGDAAVDNIQVGKLPNNQSSRKEMDENWFSSISFRLL